MTKFKISMFLLNSGSARLHIKITQAALRKQQCQRAFHPNLEVDGHEQFLKPSYSHD